MTKLDIAKEVQGQLGISQTEALELVERVLTLLKDTLKSGDPILITGFGRFTVRNKRARQGRNPRTGEPIPIAPRRVVTFHASQEFRNMVNEPHAEASASGESAFPSAPLQ
jgi:integration host factor subunit alpha